MPRKWAIRPFEPSLPLILPDEMVAVIAFEAMSQYRLPAPIRSDPLWDSDQLKMSSGKPSQLALAYSWISSMTWISTEGSSSKVPVSQVSMR